MHLLISLALKLIEQNLNDGQKRSHENHLIVELIHMFLDLAGHDNHLYNLLNILILRLSLKPTESSICLKKIYFPISFERISYNQLRESLLYQGFALQGLYRSSVSVWNNNQMSTSRLAFILLARRRKNRKSKRKCQAQCGIMKIWFRCLLLLALLQVSCENLNVCCPPKFPCQKLIPKVMVLRGEIFGK